MADAPFRMNHAAAVTPSDTALLGAVSEWLSFAGTTPANVVVFKITTPGGEVVTVSLPQGMWPIRAQQVWSTGATNLVANSMVAYW